MAFEIERRFLIKKLSDWFPFDSPNKLIKQGYFDTRANTSFRVRIKDNIYAELTTKEGHGIEREESAPEIIGIKFGQSLYSRAIDKIQKIRHNVGRWEIDFFKPPLDGIIIAEIEMNAKDEEIEIPNWIQEYEEVTDSLTSHHLARLATELEGHNVPALSFIKSLSLPRIVITGGPCSGKSTVMDMLRQEMQNFQFVPEVATIVINQLGIKPTEKAFKQFQKLVHSAGNLFEITSAQYAVLEGKLGLFLDRGLPDGAAYFDGGVSEYEMVLSTDIKNEYKRYKVVICMEVPPKDVYELNKTNNSARGESYEEACCRGDKTKKVWQNHPNFIFIDNEGGWDEKVRKVKEAISGILGRV